MNSLRSPLTDTSVLHLYETRMPVSLVGHENLYTSMLHLYDTRIQVSLGSYRKL